VKGNLAFIMPLVLIIALGAALFVGAPLLQSDQRQVNRHVEREVERARRLLERFDDAQCQLVAIRDEVEAELKAHNVNGVDLTPERIEQLLKDRPKAAQYIEEQLKTLIDQAPHRKTWAKIGADAVKTSVGASPEQQQRTLADWAKSVQSALDANLKVLDEANNIIKNAGVFAKGDASATTNPGVNRMAGIILLRRAEVAFQRSLRHRTQVAAQLGKLRSIITSINEAKGNLPLFNEITVDSQIAKVREMIAETEKNIQEQVARVKKQEGELADIRTQIQNARQQAETARRQLDGILDKGYSVTDPKSFDGFADAYTRLSDDRRSSEHKADVLEFGTLRNAQIDESGDYVKGLYVSVPGKEIEFSQGLQTRESQLKTDHMLLDGMNQTIEALKGQIQNLETIRKDLAAGHGTTNQFIQARTQSLKAGLDDLHRLRADAAATEDTAMDFAAQAGGKFQNATSAFDVQSPSAQWVGGDARALRGDSLRLRGAVLAQRVRQLRQINGIVTECMALGVGEIAPADIALQIVSAVKDAVEALKSANDAYQQAHGRFGRHFALLGSLADVQWLLADVVGPDDPNFDIHRANAEKLFQTIAKSENPLAREYLAPMAQLGIQLAPPASQPAPPAEQNDQPTSGDKKTAPPKKPAQEGAQGQTPDKEKA
jgi:DNA repair exonuclease SbcCD ATPase subunit